MVLSCVGGVAIGGTDDFGDALVLRDHPGPALAVLGWLALVNAGLFVFNLIPAFPLDGGRIARAIAWKVTGDRNLGTTLLGAPRAGGFACLVTMALGVFLLSRGDAGSRDLVDPHGLVPGTVGDRRGRLQPLLRAPGGRDHGRRHGHPARLGAR